eukprot:10875253-Lingulodinium_polyedra.AAC.1
MTGALTVSGGSISRIICLFAPSQVRLDANASPLARPLRSNTCHPKQLRISGVAFALWRPPWASLLPRSLSRRPYRLRCPRPS